MTSCDAPRLGTGMLATCASGWYDEVSRSKHMQRGVTLVLVCRSCHLFKTDLFGVYKFFMQTALCLR